jgi:L-asparaginase/Glu-tRNA(Gln) amidotransferase subunit D
MLLENVILLTTGGTIQSKYIPGKGWRPVELNYDVLGIKGYEVPVKSCRGLKDDSAKFFDYERNVKIGPTIEEYVDKNYNVAITHGTDTLVKSALVIASNLMGNKRRVVFTGSLYAPTSPNFDGERNREDAVIFAAEGYDYSGTFIVMGGKVLYPAIWGKHFYRLHDPVLEILRLGELKGIFKRLEFELHEPFDPIAEIRGGKVLMCPPRRHQYDETTYVTADGHFSVSDGGEGMVRHLDFRGEQPYIGKVAEINLALNEYARLKGIAWNYPDKRSEALSLVEDLLKDLKIDKNISDKLTKYWKEDKLKPRFDPRTNLEEVLSAEVTSNPRGYIPALKDGLWKAVVIRGLGYGNVHITEKWKDLMEKARSLNVPVVIVTEEGVITSNEYEVSRPALEKYGANFSGTLNAEEAQVRAATGIGHGEKVSLIEAAAEYFKVKPLDVFSAFYVSGLLFKDARQRENWASMRKYSTNPDIAASPLFAYEEKILLSALNHAYVCGRIKRRKKKFKEEREQFAIKETPSSHRAWEKWIRNLVPF